MTDSLEQRIRDFIQRGESLLQSYDDAKASLYSPLGELLDIGLSQVAGGIFADVFSSGNIGRSAKSWTGATLKKQRKKQLKELESRMKSSVSDWSTKIVEFLRLISSSSAAPGKPDSQRLVRKFSKTQRFVRPETKLGHGIRFLENLVEIGLVANEDLQLQQETKDGLIAKSGERLEAFVRILGILREAEGFVKVVDVYPGEDTLIALKAVPEGVPVRFLTRPPQRSEDREMFETLAQKLMSDRPEIEIRYEKRAEYHDRFILTAGDCWHVGHSIKDIGNRVSGITLMSKGQARESLEIFDSMWKEAKLWYMT